MDIFTALLEKWQARKPKSRDVAAAADTLAGNTASPLSTWAAGLLEPGIPLEVEVEYDSRYGFLHFISFKFHVQEKEIPLILKERIRLGGQRALKPKRTLDENFCPRNETLIMEQELMSWFAIEMKQHEVIKSVDMFLTAL
ncbi:hypothetical protein PHPALM_31561 [Phytophthora palmivora]|uniref:Uncharacterized protein n=1 Tax=Phytophthora palmivora TaxID=4796 RepID=A0A2P4X2B0_9STRA|nr:hypothetical protein PHPALM_31561 [Phytophthora palmivora]